METINFILGWAFVLVALIEIISLFVKGGFFGAYYEYVTELTSKSTGSKFFYWFVPVLVLVAFSWIAGLALLITRIVIWRRVQTLNQIA